MKTFKRIAFLAKKSEHSVPLAKQVLSFLERRKEKGEFKELLIDDVTAYYLKLKKRRHSTREIREKAECLVVVGGDGTFLETELRFPGLPKLCVNAGTVGFLSSLARDNWEKGLELFLQGKYRVEKRRKLECSLNGRKEYGVNDVLVHALLPSRTIRIRVESAQFSEEFSANGVVFSTPTGSTGYSLSAGGSIVFPGLECIAMTPICPVNPLHKPLVFPANEKFSVKVLDRPSFVSVDGRINEEARECEISLSSKATNFVKIFDEPLYDSLQRKLSRK